jgi:hypothetical protein
MIITKGYRDLLSAGLLTLAKAIRAGAGRPIEHISEDKILGWLLKDDSPYVFNNPKAHIKEWRVVGGTEGMPRYGLRMKVIYGPDRHATLKLGGSTYKDRQRLLMGLGNKQIRFARVPNKHDECGIAVVTV